MKKIVIHAAGNYDKLKVETAPDLVPGPGEVVVEVSAAGVNYADVIVRWGLYESAKKMVGWPITPGFEFAGRVSRLGAGVEGLEIGQKVLGVSLFNAYASQVKVVPEQLFPLPGEWSFEQGAAFPAVYLTAYHGLFQNIVLRKGARVLVHSAAGGVGGALLQLCRIAGLETIGVVGAAHKVESARSLGATHVVDKSSQDLWREVERLWPKGCDAVFDANGPSTLRDSYAHLAPVGKLVCYGFHSMMPKQGGRVQWVKLARDYLRTPRFNPLDMTNTNRSVVAFNLSFLFEFKYLLTEGMQTMLPWVTDGTLVCPPVQAFPMERVADAHAAIESGRTVGKLVLTF